jgi:hypothetical protein
MITVEFRTEDFLGTIAALKPPKADQAIAVALRQTANNGKVRATGMIAKHMSVPSRVVREFIHTDFVAVGTYVTRIRCSRRPVPLAAFPFTQTREGIQTKAWGKAQVLKSAFAATMKSGHRGIYRRLPGAGRLPIQQLWGPTVYGTFLTPDVRTGIEARLREQLPRNLARQLQSAVRRSQHTKTKTVHH